MTTVRQNIERGIKHRSLSQFVRRDLDGDVDHLIGVPVAIGAEWVVISRLADCINLDGFDALRVSDISKVNVQFRRRSFYIRSLRYKRAVIPTVAALDLDSSRGLLLSAQRSYAVLVVDREIGSPGAADVGQIARVSSTTCTMQLLTPSARRVTRRVTYRLEDVTRVGFGGEYEETLAAVAGIRDPTWT